MNTNTARFAPTSSPRMQVAWPLNNTMMRPPHSPLQNHLLAALPTEDFERLSPDLELVTLSVGEVLHEAGGRMQYVYFPTTAIVSLVSVLEDGSTAETAIIGNEGVLGMSLLINGGSTPSRALVQNAGFGYRVKVQLLKNEFDHGGPLLHVFLRYFQTLITHTAQTAVCNRHHTVEQQLCRFLLMSVDRLASNTVSMTHELIATMLGVRREGVTEAAGNIQRAGMIKYSRGKIEVLARPKLEKAACECYSVLKTEFDRLLTDIPGNHSYPMLGHSRAH